jgi:hypothetical protein
MMISFSEKIILLYNSNITPASNPIHCNPYGEDHVKNLPGYIIFLFKRSRTVYIQKKKTPDANIWEQKIRLIPIPMWAFILQSHN